MCNLKHSQRWPLKRLLCDTGDTEIAKVDGDVHLAEDQVHRVQQLRPPFLEHLSHYQQVQPQVVELFQGCHSLQKKVLWRCVDHWRTDSLTLTTSVTLGTGILGITSSVPLVNILLSWRQNKS